MLRVNFSSPKFARCLSSTASEALRTVPYLEYARSARQDVAEVMRQLEGSHSERLHGLSAMALDIWPKESPQWRLAGEVVPQEIEAKALQQELSAEGTSGEARAAMLRVLCGIRSRPSLRLAESVAKDGLVWKINLQELCRCIAALADSGWHPMPKDSSLMIFAKEGLQRLAAGAKLLALEQLLTSHRAALALNLQSSASGLTSELRKRVLRVVRNEKSDKDQKGTLGPVSSLVAAAQALNETAALRSPMLREALLPGVLGVDDATEVLRHALPDGGLTSAHEFLVSLAVRQIVAEAKQLKTRQIGAALRGVRALQASGHPFALKEASKVLQALWPRVPKNLDYFGPSELADVLCAYWWQLLYSNQEMATQEMAIAQPLPALRGDKVVQELSAKVLRPVLAQIHELPLRQVGACLTALAPPVKPPDVMNEQDRSLLRDAVSRVFTGTSESFSSEDVFVEPWMQDFWTAELRELRDVEALELTCGLREAGMTASFPMNVVMEDLNQRLKRTNQEVELSHFLLLRMCRVMDLWHRHEVEAVLQKLLSSPEALRPLPTTYFVALLSAMTSFPIPKDLPLRLVASFLDRCELGEATAQPDQWAEMLCAVRPLDEPFFERITPRLLQQLLPHLQGLSHDRLLKVLDSLAKAPPKESPGTSFASSPVEQAPFAFNEVVAEVVASGKWDLQKVMAAFSCLGRLGWYNEHTVAEVLRFVMDAPFLEPHAPLLLPLVQACSNLHVHHAPLLQKVVNWYCWCCAYLWNKPLGSEKLDELLDLAEECLELAFQSLELQGVLAENLSNPNASSRQSLRLLSVLARSSHFPPEFKATCARICSQTADLDLMSLTTEELVNAFNIHLCGVFDGPAALKRWLTEDSSMKLFFQVHTSQKWYQKQDYYRSMFRQSDAYATLRQAAEKLGLDLRTSDPGEVYHLELVSRDAKDRLSMLSEKPPLAVICISSKEQLRWYVPVTAVPSQEIELQNRCRQFNYMFRGTVQKVRHVQTMGYRPCIVWMSDWRKMQTEEERMDYLQKAAADCEFFKPAAIQDDLIYD